MSDVVFFFDDKDQDILNGLAYVWSSYAKRGIRSWIFGSDVYANEFKDMSPCEIVFVNTTLPVTMCNLLNHYGFKLTYIGNSASPLMTYADTVVYDKFIMVPDTVMSATLFAYYVYLENSMVGNRLNYLPSKLVSDDLNYIYNNNLMQLATTNINGGVFITGVNGPLLKSNIGSGLTQSRDLNVHLIDLYKYRRTLI